MIFCCSKFESRYSLNKHEYLNIRIVKFINDSLVVPTALLPAFRPSSSFPGALKGEFRFFVTMGYEKFSLSMHTLNISFCPFCGVSLYEFYKTDIIPNEIEGKTF